MAERVAADGFTPDLILAVARGGLFVAGALAYELGVKNVAVINVEFYTGVDERLDMPVVLPPVPNTVDLAGARVLIADDVADTGETLRLVRDFCADHVADARCAVLYQKPQSSVDCEYVWRSTDLWINFPWSGATAISASQRRRAGALPDQHQRRHPQVAPSARWRRRIGRPCPPVRRRLISKSSANRSGTEVLPDR